MTKVYPTFGQTPNLIQEAWMTPSKVNEKKNHLTYHFQIIKNKDKEKNPERSQREEKKSSYRGINKRIMTSPQSMQR